MVLQNFTNSTAGTTTHKCPKCGTYKIGRAHRADRLDLVLSAVNVYPYRCRQFPCKKRFYRFGRSMVEQ